MGLEELRRLIAESDRSDWNVISCLNTPSYLSWNPVEMNKHPGAYNEHLARAAYRPDVAIGLAWGITDNDDYREEWAQSFPNKHAERFIADILYNGMLVSREYVVLVDGGKGYLPRPYDHEQLLVSAWDHAFVRLLDELALAHGVGGGVGDHPRSEYDDYFRRAGFKVA